MEKLRYLWGQEMNDNVLYRKWRPLTFNEVVGQEHVTTTLINSIDLNQQVTHIFLLGQEVWAKQLWQEF